MWSIFIQSSTLIIATLALLVAYRNLKGLRRTQCIQTHMNLISLENDIRSNRTKLKLASHQYAIATAVQSADLIDQAEIERLNVNRNNAFELYISSADKLASLINTKYLKNQFKDRKWKEEYLEIFIDVKEQVDHFTEIIPGKKDMIRNLTSTLNKWDGNN